MITLSPVHGGPVTINTPGSRPLAGTEFVVSNEKGQVALFTTDEHGHFRISLGPGHYTIQKKGAESGVGRYGPFDAYVEADQMTKVEWNCDSGMR